MFYTWGCLDTPVCLYTPVHLYALRGVHIPHVPIVLCIYMFSEASACCGGYKGPLYVGHPLYTSPCGDTSSSVTPLHSFVGFLVHWCVLGISLCHMGNISLLLGVWGGISTWGFHILNLVPSCSSLCLMFLLWLQLLLPQLQWCLLGCHLFHQ